VSGSEHELRQAERGRAGARGFPAPFVLALIEAAALAVHLEDMRMVAEPIQ